MNQYWLAAPEIFLASAICIVLVVDVFLKPEHRQVTYLLAMLALVGAAVVTIVTSVGQPNVAFSGSFISDPAAGALKRIAGYTVDPRLLDDQGRPDFNVNFYVLDKAGNHAGVAFYGGPDHNYAVCDEHGPRHEPIEPLYG